MSDNNFKKEAWVKGLLGLGLGAGVGTAALTHGPQALDTIGRQFTEHVYDPAYRTVNPYLSHIGQNAGKYIGGGLSLAALLATRGRVKNIIPPIATGATSLGLGTWWDQNRRQSALDKILWENKLKSDQETWRETDVQEEDPYALPSAPPAFGETGWRPSARPMVNLAP